MTAKSLGVKKTAELDIIKSLPKTETIRSIPIFLFSQYLENLSL